MFAAAPTALARKEAAPECPKWENGAIRYNTHTGMRLKRQESCLEHSVEEKKPAAKNPLFYFKTGLCSM